MYAESDGIPVGRDELTIDHFKNWVDWAKAKGIGLDFNPTFFAHPLADSGYTQSSTDDKVRKFWIEHGKRSREIAAEIGKTLKTPCVNNIWIPDGSKDKTANRL